MGRSKKDDMRETASPFMMGGRSLEDTTKKRGRTEEKRPGHLLFHSPVRSPSPIQSSSSSSESSSSSMSPVPPVRKKHPPVSAIGPGFGRSHIADIPSGLTREQKRAVFEETARKKTEARRPRPEVNTVIGLSAKKRVELDEKLRDPTIRPLLATPDGTKATVRARVADVDRAGNITYKGKHTVDIWGNDQRKEDNRAHPKMGHLLDVKKVPKAPI